MLFIVIARKGAAFSRPQEIAIAYKQTGKAFYRTSRHAEIMKVTPTTQRQQSKMKYAMFLGKLQNMVLGCRIYY